MRYFSYLLLALSGLLLSVNDVYPQRILGAVVAGMNMTQVDGDEVYGFRKYGFNGGAQAIVPFGKSGRWSAGLEILFSQKGSYQKAQYADSSQNGMYKLSLNYVEVPVMINISDRKVIAAGTGISYGQLVGVKEWEHDRRTETSLSGGPYAKNDLSWIGEVRFRIYKRFWLDLRYSYSLMKIRTRVFDPDPGEPFTRKQYNNAISIRVQYIINEPVPERVRKQKK